MLFSCWVYGQNENNIWAFGTNAGLDFNTTPPSAILTDISGFGEASASVCNSNGTLLFYTEGSYVWDKNGNLMPNGSDLTPITSVNTISPTSSTTQGALIIPIPNNPDKYYIFSIISIEQGSNAGKLFYSVVDMSLNGGLGAVASGQKGIFLDSGMTEKMTAITGDRCNIWLLTASSPLLAFKAFEITATGINTTPVISVLGPGNSAGGIIGAMEVSLNGRRIAATQSGGSSGATLYDFDIETGIISNPLVLFPYMSSCYGVCFSPDASKLYVNDMSFGICQFDLGSNNSAQILSSKTNLFACAYTHLKSAPDNKIYFISSGSTLGSISFPNLPGTACALASAAVSLLSGSSAVAGLPNVVPVLSHDSTYSSQNVIAGCFINQLQLVAENDSTGWDYIWNTGNQGKNYTATTPGIYWVSYRTPPCDYRVDTFVLSFTNGYLPQIINQPACKGAANGQAWTYTFPGDTTTYNHVWLNALGDTLSLTDTVQGITSGNYVLRLNTGDCDTLLSFFLPEEHYSVSFLSDSFICEGADLQLQNTSDNHFTTFTWDFGDGNTTTSPNPNPTFLNPGTYTIMLQGQGAICNDTFQKSIIVDSTFMANFFLEPDSICQGSTVYFQSQIDSSVLASNWSFGDGTAMTSFREYLIQHAYDNSGMMQIRLNTHFRACPDISFSDSLYVQALPTVYLGPDTALCLNDRPLVLKNLEPAPSERYRNLWSTSDTTASLKVVHPGIYSLTVSMESLGCSTKESIEIKKGCYIDIPNAFTPDGDGENDYFFPRQLLSEQLTKFQMSIFNRWGQLIFKTENINGRGWDGKFNGKNQPQGVYLYLIQAEINGMREEKYQGNVTLIR